MRLRQERVWLCVSVPLWENTERELIVGVENGGIERKKEGERRRVYYAGGRYN